MIKRKIANRLFNNLLAIVFLWCHQESNRGHKDFQSFALPTELWHRFILVMQRYVFFFILQIFASRIFMKSLNFEKKKLF